VDSTPMGVGPPSSTRSMRPSRSSSTCAAVVADGRVKVLALGAAMGKLAALSSATATGCETTTEEDVREETEEAAEATEEKMNVKLAEAETRIAEMRAGAMAEVRNVAREAADRMVSRFGGSASKGELDKALDSALPEEAP